MRRKNSKPKNLPSADMTLHQATFKLCSNLASVEALDEIARSFALLASFSMEDAIAVSLAVREAAANAVKHGNQYGPFKTVDVDFRITRAQLCIAITDQGAGFCMGAVPDPLLDHNLLKASGRGLFLMRTIMDEVSVSGPTSSSLKHGATVSLTKNRKL